MIEELTIRTDTIDITPKRIDNYCIFNDIIRNNIMSTKTILVPLSNISSYYHELPEDNDTASVLLFYPKGNKKNSFDYVPSVAFNHIITKKYLFINKIKSELNILQKAGDIEISLDYVFNTIDDLLIEGQFDLCNSLLDNIEIKELDINILIGILTITSEFKEKLYIRESFFQKVQDFIYDIYSFEEAEQILAGLE